MKRRYTKKRIYKNLLKTILLIVLASLIGYFIFKSDILSPGIDELTASYISFNNTDKTDMLKITNISKKNEQKGISTKNKSSVSFYIDGDRDSKYQIVVYPVGKVIDEDNIYFYIENKKENIIKKLSATPTKVDGGKILYQGSINGKEHFVVRMWIDKKINKKVSPLTYEIKIKEWDE